MVPVVAAALALALPARAMAQAVDPWFGPDKALHFGISAGLAAGGYGLGSALQGSVPDRLLLGAGVALAGGVGKELMDLAIAGQPSWRDLAWDAMGTATGLLVAWTIDELLAPRPRRPPPPAPVR
jgi:putative lipoprotein